MLPETHRKFKFGDLVRKTKGSRWQGHVVGYYSTQLTEEGYAVESCTEAGSVQIYPASALELVPDLPEGVEHRYYTDGYYDVYVSAILANRYAVCVVRRRAQPSDITAELFTFSQLAALTKDYMANWIQFTDVAAKRYDGCSGGMSVAWRSLFGSAPPWESCCDEHDQAYAEGGTKEQRRIADCRLLQCVTKNGHPIWAFLMWCAVRVGGHPMLPTPWRWGFKKPYFHGYER